MARKRAWEKFWRSRSRGRGTALPCSFILITMRAAGAFSTFSITTRINRERPRLTTSCGGLHQVLFARPNLVGLFDRNHEHAAVSDLARPRRLHDGLDRLVHDRILDDDFDLHLRKQTDVVFLTAVNRRVAFLLAV